MLKVLLVDQSVKRSMPLKQTLLDVGYAVVGRISDSADLNQAVNKLQPDVIVIDVDSPSRDTLEHIVVSGADTPRPIVMFAHDGEPEQIRSATRVGVSAYVVGGLESARIRPIIDAAMARFEEFSVMKQELQSVTLKLSERKNVERAKGILMQQKQLSEQEAYALMRKMAMDKHIKLAELAQQVVDAAALLL
ncbi:MAG: ANTAR domain-containing response regulator [Methylophilaceae bacterium]